MKIIGFLFCFTIPSIIYSQSPWEVIQVFPIELYGPPIVQASFSKDDSMVIVTGNGLIVKSDMNSHVFTIDSTFYPAPFETIGSYNNIGYILSPYVEGGVIRSIDYGNNWSSLSLGLGVSLGNSIFVKNDTLLYAHSTISNVIYKSSNAGYSWAMQGTVSINCKRIQKIVFVNDTMSFLLCNDSQDDIPHSGKLRLFKTDNTTSSWVELDFPNFYGYGDMGIINHSYLLFSADNYVLKSRDWGVSFDTVYHNPDISYTYDKHISSIAFTTNSEGFIAFDSKILTSIDSGNSWFDAGFLFADGDIYNSINFLSTTSSMKIFAGCGNGNLYIKSDYLRTVKHDLLPSPTLHPNPTSTHLTISGAEPNSTANITNLHGQVVLQYEIRNPQSEISVEALPAGLYFCILQSGQERKVLRFVKQ